MKVILRVLYTHMFYGCVKQLAVVNLFLWISCFVNTMCLVEDIDSKSGWNIEDI